ncbi:hypothetical protein PPACK8108_LOCUS7396 [Phakopsora pachyrhizi]|uniref:Uncharacterized protein n=1 Tax=Phakopsora pachyrhizi TaxID=170000 RepID=A0AAV0AW47_PHAPC|nr:hypothetical protein PPACK8108_LOCUS7396 [Phakopsora pachyrhizi]
MPVVSGPVGFRGRDAGALDEDWRGTSVSESESEASISLLRSLKRASKSACLVRGGGWWEFLSDEHSPSNLAGNLNTPVQAWTAFRVFKIEWKMYGREDLQFLERVFQKLLLNSIWWVNQKDASGQNVFDGGFLIHDNIGLFNQSEPLLTGGSLGQADGTA